MTCAVHTALLNGQLYIHQKERPWPGRSRQRKDIRKSMKLQGRPQLTEVLCRPNMVTGAGEGAGDEAA